MNIQQEPDELIGFVIEDTFKIFDPEDETLTEDEQNDI